MADFSVGIVMGSDSDWPVMEAAYKILKDFGLSVDVQVISAHRRPDRLVEWIRESEKNGVGVFIAAAGMAAALPGVVAAHTTRPVIGVPLASGALPGVDALLSIVQMPPGVPVATVAIGGGGATNAAILAAQILALTDTALAEAVKNHKRKQAESVDRKNQLLQERLQGG